MTSVRRDLRSVRILGLALALGALGAGGLGAQVRWVPLGPQGGAVQSVAVAANGRAIYAGTAGGVFFRSFDRGRRWSPAVNGLRGTLSQVRTAAVAPGTVYAATSEGVFASFNAGGSWSRQSRGLPLAPLLSLEVVPSNAAALWVIARTRAGETFPFVDQVYRSFDAGASWRRADRGLPAGADNGILDLAVHPRRPQVAYAATARGVFKTTNGGGRWLPSGLAGLRVSVVAVDRQRPELLYAVAHPTFDEPRRVWVSTDGGRTWAVRSDGIDAFAIEPHPTRADTAYLLSFTEGVVVTTDGGRTWEPSADGLALGSNVWVTALAADPTRPDEAYTSLLAPGTDPGLYRSGDAGASWQPSAAGIVATQVGALALPPDDPDALFAGLAGDGVQRLDLAAGLWTQRGFDRQEVAALAVDRQAPDTLFASVGHTRDVHRTTDAGLHWQAVSTDFPTTFKVALTVINGALWAAGNFGIDTWDPAHGWQRRHDCDCREIASAGAGPAAWIWWNDTAHLDAGGGFDTLLESTDAGATFDPARVAPAGEVLDIALAPGDPDLVAAGIGSPGLGSYDTGGLLLSDDGGATWRPARVGRVHPPIFALARSPRDPRRLAAGTRGTVFESLDGGATWANISLGLARGATVTDLAFDAQGRLYAATAGAGV